MSKMSKKDKVCAIISHVLVLLWMLVIFSFSSQIGEESADFSGGISHLLMTIWNHVFDLGWDEAKILAMAELLGYPIRKLAHMTEFGILAVLIFVVTKYYAKIKTMKQRYCIAWIATVCYAATDEFHQLFVPERSGNLFDVGVDSTGALIALVITFITVRIFQKVRRKRRDRVTK